MGFRPSRRSRERSPAGLRATPASLPTRRTPVLGELTQKRSTENNFTSIGFLYVRIYVPHATTTPERTHTFGEKVAPDRPPPTGGLETSTDPPTHPQSTRQPTPPTHTLWPSHFSEGLFETGSGACGGTTGREHDEWIRGRRGDRRGANESAFTGRGATISRTLTRRAWVAKPGQRRSVEGAVP